MLIKEFIDKMKEFNNKKINHDICDSHNEKYECYCLKCNIHLSKECLKLRNHINHNKNNIIEIQPNRKELESMENIIKDYDNKKENLEKEKFVKENELNNKLKEYKNKINESKKLRIKDNKKKMKEELKNNRDKYISEI